MQREDRQTQKEDRKIMLSLFEQQREDRLQIQQKLVEICEKQATLTKSVKNVEGVASDVRLQLETYFTVLTVEADVSN